MTKTQIIEAGVAAVALAVCLVLFILNAKKPPAANGKKPKGKKLSLIGMIIAAWFLIGLFISALTGKTGKLHIAFEMFSERVELFGFSLAKTTLTGAGVLAVLILLLVVLRLTVIRKFSVDEPKGLQLALETAVDFMDNMVKGNVHGYTPKDLQPFMLGVALYMFGCALTELFGLRAPTSDLTFTFALGLTTFVSMNVYGIKKNGVGGRLKNMGGAVPAMRPLMIPLKAVSDVSIPVSLGARLFGNMLGGMLVMDLLKGVLGGYASGLPAIAGLWFNLAHPGIQIYIFVTLSLTFINQAMELEEA